MSLCVHRHVSTLLGSGTFVSSQGVCSGQLVSAKNDSPAAELLCRAITHSQLLLIKLGAGGGSELTSFKGPFNLGSQSSGGWRSWFLAHQGPGYKCPADNLIVWAI